MNKRGQASDNSKDEVIIILEVDEDSNRASDVISYGVGAGALVVGLAIFAFATKKNNGKIGSKK